MKEKCTFCEKRYLNKNIPTDDGEPLKYCLSCQVFTDLTEMMEILLSYRLRDLLKREDTEVKIVIKK